MTNKTDLLKPYSPNSKPNAKKTPRFGQRWSGWGRF